MTAGKIKEAAAQFADVSVFERSQAVTAKQLPAVSTTISPAPATNFGKTLG